MSKQKILLEREQELYEYEGEDKIVSSHELWEELQKTKESVYSLPSGFPSLERILGGSEAGELVVVTGPTGEGKTTLLMSITKNMAERNILSAWFTLEVTPRQFIKKIAPGGKLPLFYVPQKNAENTLDWIEARIIEAKVKHNIQCVFIDHIHQIFSLQRSRGNISLEIGDMVAKIKQIALDQNLVVFLIAHSRDDGQNPTREPTKEDIRDSGLISRLADTIIGVWRIRNEDDLTVTKRKPLGEMDTKAKVRVMKNRKTGQLGTFIAYHQQHFLTEDAFYGSNI